MKRLRKRAFLLLLLPCIVWTFHLSDTQLRGLYSAPSKELATTAHKTKFKQPVTPELNKSINSTNFEEVTDNSNRLHTLQGSAIHQKFKLITKESNVQQASVSDSMAQDGRKSKTSAYTLREDHTINNYTTKSLNKTSPVTNLEKNSNHSNLLNVNSINDKYLFSSNIKSLLDKSDASISKMVKNIVDKERRSSWSNLLPNVMLLEANSNNKNPPEKLTRLLYSRWKLIKTYKTKNALANNQYNVLNLKGYRNILKDIGTVKNVSDAHSSFESKNRTSTIEIGKKFANPADYVNTLRKKRSPKKASLFEPFLEALRNKTGHLKNKNTNKDKEFSNSYTENYQNNDLQNLDQTEPQTTASMEDGVEIMSNNITYLHILNNFKHKHIYQHQSVDIFPHSTHHPSHTSTSKAYSHLQMLHNQQYRQLQMQHQQQYQQLHKHHKLQQDLLQLQHRQQYQQLQKHHAAQYQLLQNMHLEQYRYLKNSLTPHRSKSHHSFNDDNNYQASISYPQQISQPSYAINSLISPMGNGANCPLNEVGCSAAKQMPLKSQVDHIFPLTTPSTFSSTLVAPPSTFGKI